jgi:uracil-DNA glycosylase
MSTASRVQSQSILAFYQSLQPAFALPPGIALMHPFLDAAAWQTVQQFYEKFYQDALPRLLVFGINPGRLGGGITGIPFTDPFRLETACGIPNDFKKVKELSSEFIYEVADACGGAAAFYSKVFITAVCPLGFTKHDKNLNYYDDKQLQRNAEPFIIACIRQQIATIAAPPVCVCLGEGANYNYFSRLNDTHGFFRKIIALPHPRWVMQYRRKTKQEFVERYREVLCTPYG